MSEYERVTLWARQCVCSGGGPIGTRAQCAYCGIEHIPVRYPPAGPVEHVPLAAIGELVQAAARAGAILVALLADDEVGTRHAPEVRRAMELAEVSVREALGRPEWAVFQEE